MRHLAVLAAFCVLFAATPVNAEEPPAPPSPAPKVEVLEDQEAGVVRVMIGGKEALRIDAEGLHVNGDVNYTGVITDTNGAAPDAP